MEKIYDQFNNIEYRNEADVSLNFVIPLLTQYLSYHSDEILPEVRFPVKDIIRGVTRNKKASKKLNVKPDYIICIDGNTDAVKFILDSKGPKEDIDNDDHLGQLKSYAVAVGVNILVITNGTNLKIYDVNNLIFESKGIEDLDLKFTEFEKLLSRESQSLKDHFELLRNVDLDKTLGKSSKKKIEEVKKKRKVKLSQISKIIPGFNSKRNILEITL
ncbi:MAG: hypothetical protein V1872_02040 [bacterium]